MKNQELELGEELKESLNQNGLIGKIWPKYKRSILIGVVAIIALAVIYAEGLQYYTTNFFPETYINGINYGNTSRDSVWSYVEGIKPQVQIDVAGQDDSHFTFALADISEEYVFADESAIAEGAGSDIWAWPIHCLGRRDITAKVVLNITNKEVKDYLDKAYAKMDIIEPQDAYVEGYDKSKKSFTVVEEVYGNKPDTQLVADIIMQKLEEMDTTVEGSIDVDLIAAGAIEKPSVTSDDKELNDVVAKANKYLKSDITYNWNGSEVHIPVDTIASWVSIDGTEVTLDEAAIKKYLNGLAEEYDTYEKAGSFKTADGRVKSIPRRLFGFKADIGKEAGRLAEQIEKGASVTLDVYSRNKGYVIGSNDWGNSYVEVDMTAQVLYLWVDGNQVLSTPVVTGDMATGCNSPEGIFGVKYKKTETVLRGATWNDFVYYWMPYWKNYGMHDATWRDQFGGEIYKTSGSHGCVNIPLEAAGVVFNTVDTGFPVICYY